MRRCKRPDWKKIDEYRQQLAAMREWPTVANDTNVRDKSLQALNSLDCAWSDMPLSVGQDGANMPVFCCLSDNGYRWETRDTTVMGGLVLPKRAYKSFNADWKAALRRHEMGWGANWLPQTCVEFPRKQGVTDRILSCLADLGRVINKHKTYSLSVTVVAEDGDESSLLKTSEGELRPSTVAFAYCILLNYLLTHNAESIGQIAYVLPDNEKATCRLSLYHSMRQFVDNAGGRRLGAVVFDVRENTNMFQAAHLVARSNGARNGANGRLTSHWRDPRRSFPHFHIEPSKESIRYLGRILDNRWSPLRRPELIRALFNDVEQQEIQAALRIQRKRDEAVWSAETAEWEKLAKAQDAPEEPAEAPDRDPEGAPEEKAWI